MQGLLGVDFGLLSAGTNAFKPAQPQIDMRDFVQSKPQLSPEVAALPNLPQDPSMLAGLQGSINSALAPVRGMAGDLQHQVGGLRDQAVMGAYNLYNQAMPPPPINLPPDMTGGQPTGSSQRQQDLMKMILNVVGGGM